MGLYINSNDHDIYKTDQQIVDSNQRLFVKRHQDQIIEEQRKLKEQLTHSFQELKQLQENQKDEQKVKWKKVTSQMTTIQSNQERHKVLENEVLEKLHRLEAGHDTLHKDAQDRQIVEEEFTKELNHLTVTQQSIIEKLVTLQEVNQVLNDTVEKQVAMERQLREGMEIQEKNQEEVNKRLENQEALTEKVYGQLDHLRSIIYERTNYLSEKLERISSYVSNAILEDPFQQKRFVLKKENMKK